MKPQQGISKADELIQASCTARPRRSTGHEDLHHEVRPDGRGPALRWAWTPAADRWVLATVNLPHGRASGPRAGLRAGYRAEQPRRPDQTTSGADDLIGGSRAGFLDFDAVVATTDMMARSTARPVPVPAGSCRTPIRHGHDSTSARPSVTSRARQIEFRV